MDDSVHGPPRGLEIVQEKEDAVWFQCGGGSRLAIGASTIGTADEQDQATWRVDDVAAEVAQLRARSVEILDLDAVRWGPARLPLPTGGEHVPLDPNAELTVGEGEVRVAIPRFSLSHDRFQSADSPKYLIFSTRRLRELW